jgi:lysophospholipase L1-like esterase
MPLSLLALLCTFGCIAADAQFVDPTNYNPAPTTTAADDDYIFSAGDYGEDAGDNMMWTESDYGASGGDDYGDLETVAKYPDMGGTSTTVQVSDSKLPDSKVTVVACLGDSITQGYRSSPGKSFPEALQSLLGDSYEVYNLGVGGTTVGMSDEDGQWSQDLMYAQTTEFRESLQISPDIVVVMLGTNDAKTAPPHHEWGDRDENFVSEFNNILNSVKQLESQPTVFIALPPPLYVDGNFAMNAAVINNVLPSVLRDIAAENELPPVIDTFSALGGTGLSHPELMTMVDPGDGYTADGCHPNDAGYDEIARAVYNAIKDYNPVSPDLTYADDLFAHGAKATTASAKSSSEKKGSEGSSSGSTVMVMLCVVIVVLAGVAYFMFMRQGVSRTKTTKAKLRRTPGASAAGQHQQPRGAASWAVPSGSRPPPRQQRPVHVNNPGDNVSVM